MIWDGDRDVKEYRPKKRGVPLMSPMVDHEYPVPIPETYNRWEENADHSGIDMTTSEILDFAEGADSY